MTVVLDERTTDIFIQALRDPKMAKTLSILANNTDANMPQVVQNQAWKAIEKNLDATIYRWGPPIMMTSSEDESA